MNNHLKQVLQGRKKVKEGQISPQDTVRLLEEVREIVDEISITGTIFATPYQRTCTPSDVIDYINQHFDDDNPGVYVRGNHQVYEGNGREYHTFRLETGLNSMSIGNDDIVVMNRRSQRPIHTTRLEFDVDSEWEMVEGLR